MDDFERLFTPLVFKPEVDCLSRSFDGLSDRDEVFTKLNVL